MYLDTHSIRALADVDPDLPLEPATARLEDPLKKWVYRITGSPELLPHV